MRSLALVAALGLAALLLHHQQWMTQPTSSPTTSAPQPQARRLRSSTVQLDAVQLEAPPSPSITQVSSFRTCLGESLTSTVGAGSSNVVTEAGRSGLTVTVQQDSKYSYLRNYNAQKRGERLQPVAFAEPSSAVDIAAVVKCAASAGLKFAARNGGHSYEANSLLDGGVVIDLNKLQKIKINAAAGTVTVGGGQKLGPVYAALASNGYVVPGGTCVGVGISGTTLGGGFGHATRVLGLLADNVLQATVVLASGQVVTANATSEPDLFWAIRGGGPFYGIVTEWKFKIHKAPQKAALVKYGFQQKCTEAQFIKVLEAWNAWKPWELSLEHAFIDIQCGYNALTVQMWYWGSLQDALKSAKASPVYQLPGAREVRVEEYSWQDFVVKVITNLADSPTWSAKELGYRSVAQNQGSFVAGSLLAKSPMSSAAIVALSKAAAEVQEHGFVQARAWGGQMKATPSDFNAFAWRSTLYEFQVYSNSGTADDRTWVDKTLSTLHPLMKSQGELYNYFHCVKDPWRVFFGRHAARLQDIKGKYDPGNKLGGLNCQRGVVLSS